MAIVKLFINSVEKTLYEVDLAKEGERAVDQIRLKVPKSVAVTVNQEIKYLQDIVDLSKLIAVYNFQGNTEDEGGYGYDGTALSPSLVRSTSYRLFSTLLINSFTMAISMKLSQQRLLIEIQKLHSK